LRELHASQSSPHENCPAKLNLTYSWAGFNHSFVKKKSILQKDPPCNSWYWCSPLKILKKSLGLCWSCQDVWDSRKVVHTKITINWSIIFLLIEINSKHLILGYNSYWTQENIRSVKRTPSATTARPNAKPCFLPVVNHEEFVHFTPSSFVTMSATLGTHSVNNFSQVT
jgi:hypothetical protein